MTTIRLDHLDPAFTADPYPTWKALRDLDPVWWWEDVGAWMVTGHPEVRAVLSDERTSPSRRYWDQYVPKPPDEREYWERFEEGGLFHVSREDHVRLRRLVSRALTPAAVEAQRPYVRALVDDALGEVHEGDVFDAAALFANRIPPQTIAHFVGVEGTSADTFKHLADDLIRLANPLADDDDRARGNAAAVEMDGLLSDAIEDRRARPRDDLLSRLVAVEEAGDRLSHVEMVSLVMSLLVAGSDTSVSLISLGLLELGRHADQRALLVRAPDLMPAAVEELLRFSFVGKGVVHFVVDDIDVGDHRLRAGQMVWANVGAANRDPRVFPSPDTLDLRRDTSASIPFGVGAHYCLGAALARLEGQEAIGGFLRRFPAYRMAGEPVWNVHFMLRGLESLPLELA